tara:strand:+ start:200 stop:940 length:741 start_codon:yes stop_codon:yes gene_type:complete
MRNTKDILRKAIRSEISKQLKELANVNSTHKDMTTFNHNYVLDNPKLVLYHGTSGHYGELNVNTINVGRTGAELRHANEDCMGLYLTDYIGEAKRYAGQMSYRYLDSLKSTMSEEEAYSRLEAVIYKVVLKDSVSLYPITNTKVICYDETDMNDIAPHTNLKYGDFDGVQETGDVQDDKGKVISYTTRGGTPETVIWNKDCIKSVTVYSKGKWSFPTNKQGKHTPPQRDWGWEDNFDFNPSVGNYN